MDGHHPQTAREPLEPWNREPLSALAARVLSSPATRRLFELMRDEDLGDPPRDATARAIGDDAGAERVEARIVAREPMTLAGLAALPELASAFGDRVRVGVTSFDGASADAGDGVATLAGPRSAVTTLERSALNLLGRLCGVATNTRRYVGAVAPGSAARLYDTRKTTPGMRMLEKYAVRCGGGCCHRFGLFDAVMIKDNHAASASDVESFGRFVRAAAERARGLSPEPVFVEVEVDREDQFDAVLGLPAGLVDVVLLDNMGPDRMAACARLRDERAPGMLLEASGGITIETIGEVSATGVDRISVGSLTRDASTLDLGLDID